MKKAVVTCSIALLALLAVALFRVRSSTEPPARAAVPRHAPSAAPSASALVDPIAPNRFVELDPSPRAESPDWVKARPGFQSSRRAAERGGIEPCATQPVDTSGFAPWSGLAHGQLLVPREAAVDPSGQFTLVIHLHGSEPVRRELAESHQHFVLYAITLDPSQSYAPLFAGGGLDALATEVEQALSKQVGRSARVAHLVLSAWSAGFSGVEAALAQPGTRRIDAVILIDGLHAPRGNAAAFQAQLAPFVEYAKLAARGERFFFVSHSSIDPPDFASTTECAHYVISALSGKPQAVRRSDRFGLEMVEFFSRGDFHVRGYAGNDKADHCAQLALLRDVYAALGLRWDNPAR